MPASPGTGVQARYRMTLSNGSGCTGNSWKGPAMALNEIWMPSPHYSSSRGPAPGGPSHHRRGPAIESLGGWFANPSAHCSCRPLEPITSSAGYSARTSMRTTCVDSVGQRLLYLYRAVHACPGPYWVEPGLLARGARTLRRNAAEWLRYCAADTTYRSRPLPIANRRIQAFAEHVDTSTWVPGGRAIPIVAMASPSDRIIEWAKSGAAIAPVPEAGT